MTGGTTDLSPRREQNSAEQCANNVPLLYGNDLFDCFACQNQVQWEISDPYILVAVYVDSVQ